MKSVNLFAAMLTILSEVKSSTKEVKTFGIFIKDPSFIKNIKLGPSSGGIVLISEKEIGKIQDLSKFDKTAGVPETSTIAMFPDGFKALKEGFKKLANIA